MKTTKQLMLLMLSLLLIQCNKEDLTLTLDADSQEVPKNLTAKLERLGIPVTATAAFLNRYDHTTIVFDDKLWVIGGLGGFYNDVWNSIDGKNWQQVTPAAGFSLRHGHTTVVFDNKIWVIGGSGPGNNHLNDVWNSTDGIIWSEVTSVAGFSPRYKHTTAVFNDKLWVIGGLVQNSEGTVKNDVWYSSDGKDWEEATPAAGFSRRGMHTTVVFNDKLWVIGGWPQQNDAWYSSNGTHWSRATSASPFSGSFRFSERALHTSVVFDDKLWVIGGMNDVNRLFSDVWNSSDGSKWTRFTPKEQFSARSGHTSAVFKNKIWVIAGADGHTIVPLRDVWTIN